MKTLLKLVFLMVITCMLLSCNESVIYDESSESVLKSADVPTPNIIGNLDLNFSISEPLNFWNGTIDFGDYGIYDISFFSFPSKAEPQFEEEFIIYKLGTDWENPENIVMKGSHKGRVIVANNDTEQGIWLSNGIITEANPPFEICMGRTQHIKGSIYGLDAIPYAEGIMRIN